MKLAVLENLIREAFDNGFFEEVTEDIINDDKEFNHLLKAFISELRKKRVVRGKKLYKKTVYHKNKKYVPTLKKCIVKTAGKKMKKRRAMRRAAIKKRGQMAKIIRKRRKSMKKRKAFGLKRAR